MKTNNILNDNVNNMNCDINKERFEKEIWQAVENSEKDIKNNKVVDIYIALEELKTKYNL